MESATGQIYSLIPKIMLKVGAIGKDRKNQQQGYAFRGIDDMYNALQGPMADHGVFVVPEVMERSREEHPTRDQKGVLFYTILKVKHSFFAPDGSHVDAITIGEAMDSGDKSSNKSMSAAMKYALIEVFSIPTEGDNDTENQTHEVKTAVTPERKTTAIAKPVLMGDELKKAQDQIDDAFKARNFSPEDADAIIKAVLMKTKFTGINMAGKPWVEKVVKHINAGDYDKMKKTNGKAA